jgi:anti-anti-sigma factor
MNVIKMGSRFGAPIFRRGGTMSLEVEVLKSDSGRCRIELRGRLDTSSAEQLDQKLESIDPTQHKVQVVDLSGLEYISSAGIRSLFRAKKIVTDKGGEFLITHPQPQVRKVFDVVKAITDGIFSSQQELDHYLDVIQRKALSDRS